jgi:AcrR family transcriptional regulator
MSSTRDRIGVMPSTRDRIVETSAELFRAQGYNATGVKQIVTAAKAPFGSLYHFFPGGKEQLGAEAIVVSGALYEELIPAVLEPAPDPVTGVRNFFAGAAEHLRETDYADACPIATVALEVSSSSEPMRQACAQVFESWIEAGTRYFTGTGLAPETACELTITMLSALEGAFVLARALRSTEPLIVAGEHAAVAVDEALDATPAETLEEALDATAAETLEEQVVEPAPAPRKPRLRARWPSR